MNQNLMLDCLLITVYYSIFTWIFLIWTWNCSILILRTILGWDEVHSGKNGVIHRNQQTTRVKFWFNRIITSSLWKFIENSLPNLWNIPMQNSITYLLIFYSNSNPNANLNFLNKMKKTPYLETWFFILHQVLLFGR